MSRKTDQKARTRFLNASEAVPEDSLRAEVLAIATAAMPNECAGFILTTPDGKSIVRRTENAHGDPESHARISADDFERATADGEIRVVWHSHVNERPDPSPADKTTAEKSKLPILIVSVPTAQWAYYEPAGWIAPLRGRPFVHGVLDCWTVIRDAYKLELGVELPDFERADDWWWPLRRFPDGTEKRAKVGGEIIGPPLNTYLENVTAAGFRQVSRIQKWDAVLMQIGGADVPNHAALYVGDGHILHHVAGRPSCEVPYVVDFGYYARHTYGLFRHESQPDLEPEC